MHEYVGQKVTIQNIIPKSLNRLQTYLLEFWLFVLRYVGYVPIHTFRKIIYLLSGVKMPFSSTIHIGANFFNPSGISIGHNTIIGDHCFLDGRAPLIIGNHVDIASNVSFYNDEHDINSPDFSNSYGKIEVGDYVFIGPKVIVLPNIKIGKGAVIAAGAVVTKNVPDFEVWGGVPATKISERKLKDPKYKLGRPMLFQ